MSDEPHARPAAPTPADIIGRVAPEAIRSILLPGAAITTAYCDTRESVAWQVTSCEDEGGDAYAFTCESPSPLRATCTVELDREHTVAVHRATLTNTSNERSRPIREAAALYLQFEGVTRPAVFTCRGAGSNASWPHAREFPPDAFRTHWMVPLSPRPVHLESGARAAHQLVSSTQDLPIFMVRPEFEEDGPGFFVGLEWPTRWQADITFGPDRTGLRLAVGPTVDQMVLDPGETIELPVVHLGFFDGPFSAGTNACRRYISDRITPRYRGMPMLPPVTYTLWGSPRGYRQDHVTRQIDIAADMGVELFCCDQSWYVGGDWGGQGNWEVDLERFPDGLEPVAERVRARGMGMGLYFESFAYDDTKMLREHPEFFLRLESASGRSHFLNFALPEACEYFTDLISQYVEQLDLRFIRADFGGYPRPPEGVLTWAMFDPDDKIQFAYAAGKFRVWETLLRRHPKLMWELNAGGGNCLDLGSMRRHHCAWGSDMMDMHTARMMQLGAASFLPGNFMGSAVICGEEGPQGSDSGMDDISFLSRMAGSFYVCGCIDTWPEEARHRARHWIGVYKRIRHLLVEDFHRLLPQPQSDEEWDAAQFCSGDRQGIVFVFRYRGRPGKQRLVLHNMRKDAVYAIRDEGSGRQLRLGGGVLREEGLPVELPPDSAKLIFYEQTE